MKFQKTLMNKLLIVMALGASTLGVTECIQPARAAGKAGTHRFQEKRAQRFETLSRTLNLSAAQKARIRPIMDDSYAQSRAIRRDTTLSPEQRMSQIRALHSMTRTRISAVLNTDQKRTYATLRMQKRKNLKGLKMQNKAGVKTKEL